MSKLLNSKDFGTRLYNTLPEIYRTEDSFVDYTLKRFIQSLSEGGFAKVIDEINGLTYLLDPERIPAEILPIAFKHYGLEVFNGIPELFLRKLLPMISELYSRKGTITAIEYLTSVISGVKAIVEVDPDFNENYGIDVRLEMDYGDKGKDLPDRDQLLRIIEEFIPFFCDVTIIYVYLFYEFGKLQAKDIEDTMRVKQRCSSENSTLVSNQSGLSLSLNIPDVLLNSGLYLNDTYYYNYIADWYKDVVNTIYKEVCGITRVHSNKYLVETLNESSKKLNNGFTLNLPLETDYYKDIISFKVMEDKSKTVFTEQVLTNLETKTSEQAGIYAKGLPVNNTAVFGEAIFAEAVFGTDNNHVDTRFDEVKESRSDKVSISSNITKELSPALNKVYAKLNSCLVLNEFSTVDGFSDVPCYLPVMDTSFLSKEDGNEKTHLSFHNNMMWILNSKNTLNNFLIGEYSSADVSHLKSVESIHYSMAINTEDIAIFREPIDTFLNLGYNVLNNMFYLNGLSCYDKITVGGKVTIIAPLETGNIIL